jgi:hypothetical protein
MLPLRIYLIILVFSGTIGCQEGGAARRPKKDSLDPKHPPLSAEKVQVLTVPADPNTFYFPVHKGPHGQDNRDQSLDSFTNRWYSQVLLAVKEPTLYNYSGPLEVYRFTYIPSLFNFPVMLTLRINGKNISMTAKAHAHWGGYKPDSINMDTTIVVSSKDWNHFQHLLEKAAFWTLQGDTNDRGFDGVDCILEGSKDGNYHFAVRWTPGGGRYPEFWSCCDYLRSLARKSLDFHHMF